MQYAELYDRVDVERAGAIEWDAFASHMLLELYEREDRARTAQVPNWRSLRTLTTPHREVVQRIIYSRNNNRYYILRYTID